MKTELVVDVCPNTFNKEVVYTPQMARNPRLRACYEIYRRDRDKTRYYACLRREIARKLNRPNLSMEDTLKVLHSMGMSQCEDLRIRIQQVPDAKKFRRFDLVLDGVVPFLAVGALGALLLSRKCKPCMAPDDIMLNTMAFGAMGVAAHWTATYLKANY